MLLEYVTYTNHLDLGNWLLSLSTSSIIANPIAEADSSSTMEAK